MRVRSYLFDQNIQPATQTCRVKVWAHDNAFTLFWIMGWAIGEAVVTVIVCHG